MYIRWLLMIYTMAHILLGFSRDPTVGVHCRSPKGAQARMNFHGQQEARLGVDPQKLQSLQVLSMIIVTV